jgi:hypothetical protein
MNQPGNGYHDTVGLIVRRNWVILRDIGSGGSEIA